MLWNSGSSLPQLCRQAHSSLRLCQLALHLPSLHFSTLQDREHLCRDLHCPNPAVTMDSSRASYDLNSTLPIVMISQTVPQVMGVPSELWKQDWNNDWPKPLEASHRTGFLAPVIGPSDSPPQCTSSSYDQARVLSLFSFTFQLKIFAYKYML